MGKITDEFWQMVADELKVEVLTQEVKNVCERVYWKGMEDMLRMNQDSITLAEGVSYWLSTHNADSERKYICEELQKLTDDDKKHAEAILELLSSIIVAKQSTKGKSLT